MLVIASTLSAKTAFSCLDEEEEKLIASKPKIVKRASGRVSSLVFKLENGKELVLTDQQSRCEQNEAMKNYTLSEFSPDGKWVIVEVTGYEAQSLELYSLVNGKKIDIMDFGGNVAWSSDGEYLINYSENTCTEVDDHCIGASRGEIYRCVTSDCKSVWRLGSDASHLIKSGDVVKGISFAGWNKSSVSATLILMRNKRKIELSLNCGIYQINKWGCARDD